VQAALERGEISERRLSVYRKLAEEALRKPRR
jgi:putative ribosome biogenesis GTPase RsgA